MAGQFADSPTLTRLKDVVTRLRTHFASGDFAGMREAAGDGEERIDTYIRRNAGAPDVPSYRAAVKLLVQLEMSQGLKQSKPHLLKLETLVGVGPGLEGERYREGAVSVGAMSSTSKTGVLGKFGLDVPGVDSTVASYLTGSPDYVAPGAQKSEAATKAGLPGVRGSSRRGRKSRKSKKRMTRRMKK